MEESKIYKIALVLKTNGLEYDDRVRKEIKTIQKLFGNIKFKIFAMLPDNKEFEGITSYGIPFKSIYLPSRSKYKSSKNKLLKAFEFYKVISNELKEYDAIWCGDRHCFMVAALVDNKRILWDLHELPYEFFGNKIKGYFLKYIFRRCKVIIHANPQRLEYLKTLKLVDNIEKHYSIRNFPNFDDVDSIYDDNYNKFVKWKNNRKCVYLQGLNDNGRAAYESVTTILKEKDLVAVIIGHFDGKALEKLKAEWKEDLYKKIYFAGRIPQLKIPQYVNQCFFSLIFYKNIRANNFYCEANRFYQSVIMGLPVVVGNNPPMRELIDKYGFGISIDDDGGNIDKICMGIEDLLKNYDKFKANNLKFRNNLIWDNQEPKFIEIIQRLFTD